MSSDENRLCVFEGLIGQSFAISLLKGALEKNHIAPAYIFSGPKGVGRKYAAISFFEALISGGIPKNEIRQRLEKGSFSDLLFIEPTFQNQGKLIPQSIARKENLSGRNKPQIRLEQIKEIKHFMSKNPIEGKLNMILIDEFELTNESAANALLKTLEEPAHGIFILLSESTQKLPSTIISRCHKIPFFSLKKEEIDEVIKRSKVITDFEKLNKDEVQVLLRLANGSPGQLIKDFEIFQEIPESIITGLKNIPLDTLGSLTLAKDIDEKLSLDKQIWLINWLQHITWIKSNNGIFIKTLEKLRYQLIAFVQPRVAWEIAILNLRL